MKKLNRATDEAYNKEASRRNTHTLDIQTIGMYGMLHLDEYCSSYSGSESVDDYNSLSTIQEYLDTFLYRASRARVMWDDIIIPALDSSVVSLYCTHYSGGHNAGHSPYKSIAY
eukprot:scaffold667_cov103-Skeletonema_dohrnii-CCMP3373.AAC.16